MVLQSLVVAWVQPVEVGGNLAGGSQRAKSVAYLVSRL